MSNDPGANVVVVVTFVVHPRRRCRCRRYPRRRCLQACTHASKYVCMYACVHVCMYAGMYVCISVSVRMYVCVYVVRRVATSLTHGFTCECSAARSLVLDEAQT